MNIILFLKNDVTLAIQDDFNKSSVENEDIKIYIINLIEKAPQKCGAFLNFISKIAGLVESVVVCVCVAKRRCNAHDNT